MFARYQTAILKQIMSSWFAVTTSPSSRKQVVANYKARRLQARQNLSDSRKEATLITRKMVRTEMNQQAIKVMQ